ncbi:MAG: hypothetical protein AAF449_21315 [Myxococcota bacterium]
MCTLWAKISEGLWGFAGPSKNPDRVASITMFETLWARLSSLDAVPPPFGGQEGFLATMRSPITGPEAVGPMNLFLNMLSGFTVSGISPADQEVYQFPWSEAEDRVRVFLPSGPLAFPFPEDVEAANFIGEYEDYLRVSETPKLVIDVQPGILSSVEVELVGGSTLTQVAYAESVFPNTEVQTLSPSGHFVQEDLGEQLGGMIDAFVRDVTSRN